MAVLNFRPNASGPYGSKACGRTKHVRCGHFRRFIGRGISPTAAGSESIYSARRGMRHRTARTGRSDRLEVLIVVHRCMNIDFLTKERSWHRVRSIRVIANQGAQQTACGAGGPAAGAGGVGRGGGVRVHLGHGPRHLRVAARSARACRPLCARHRLLPGGRLHGRRDDCGLQL